jgi:hypothetical protein
MIHDHMLTDVFRTSPKFTATIASNVYVGTYNNFILVSFSCDEIGSEMIISNINTPFQVFLELIVSIWQRRWLKDFNFEITISNC